MKATSWSICFLLLLSIALSQRIIAYGEDSDQATYRKMVWQQSDQRIKKMNEEHGRSFRSDHNEFSDLTDEQFKATMTGGSMSPLGSIFRTFVESPNSELRKNLKAEEDAIDELTLSKAAILNSIIPTVFNVDYSVSTAERPAYSGPVRNQGSCGSCWAFSGIAEIQSYFLKEHKLSLDLSEQQMVDCLPAVQSGNSGCGGGYLDSVGYFSARFGIALERFYPYTAQQAASCNNVKVAAGPTWNIKTYVYVQDCLATANYLLNNRPFGICGAIGNEWKFYKKGVMQTCDQLYGGHCVLLVGAASDGTSALETNFWKIRNSWGTGWGEQGYARLYRDPSDKSKGLCGFCREGLYSI